MIQLQTQVRKLTTDELSLGLILKIAKFDDYSIDHTKLFINLRDKDKIVVTLKFTDIDALFRVTKDIDYRLKVKITCLNKKNTHIIYTFMSLYNVLKTGYINDRNKQAKLGEKHGYNLDKQLTNISHQVYYNPTENKLLYNVSG
jgi:hypothetical protein